MDEYKNVLLKRLEDFLKEHKNQYMYFICYLRPDSDTFKVMLEISKNFREEIINCCKSTLDPGEEKEISLDGIYDDCDHILIKKSNLDSLASSIISLLEH